MDETISLLNEIIKHHKEEVAELHELLAASEKRISDTNQMVRTLTDTCRELKDTYQYHIKTVAESRDAALATAQKLLQENERLLKENEAYYNALQTERKRYDSAMQSVITSYAGRTSAPMVKIDQK